MSKLGIWLFRLACLLNPAIPQAIVNQANEQVRAALAQQADTDTRVAIALARHQHAVAERAARQ